MQYLLYQRGQCLEREALLVVISMHVIGAPNSRYDVPGSSLSMIRRDPSPRHQRPRGASQIMKSPARDATSFVKCPLEFGKSTDGACAVAGEHVPTIPMAADDWHRFEQGECGR